MHTREKDYLAAITVAVCEQYPTTAAALSQVQLVFGVGLRRRALTTFYRAGGGEADAPLPLVEIAAVGGLSPAETCHVVLHELAHVLAPDAGHGKAWRHAARQVGLLRPCAWPDSGALADWREIAPAIRATLQAIPEPTESLPAEYYDDWHRRPCAAGYGTRGGTSRGEGSGSRYLKVACQHPGCGYQVRVTRKWLALGAPRADGGLRPHPGRVVDRRHHPDVEEQVVHVASEQRRIILLASPVRGGNRQVRQAAGDHRFPEPRGRRDRPCCVALGSVPR